MSPPPPPPDLPDWPTACTALAAAFTRFGALYGFTLNSHNAAECHFETCLDGPDYALLGIDWVSGVVRWGSLYMPKQDGGYDSSAPLPESWLLALRRLRFQTWGEDAPRFATPADAGPSLLQAVERPAAVLTNYGSLADWVERPFATHPGPGGVTTESVGRQPGGVPIDILWAPCGHPLDTIVLALDRAAGTVSATLLDAEGPRTALGQATLAPALLADVRRAAWPAGWPSDPAGEAQAWATLPAAARDLLDAAPAVDSTPGPIHDFAARFAPPRWRLPGVDIGWSGPSWRFVDDVPHTTIYGRFRGTQAWLGVVFTPDFARATCVENIMGARPGRQLLTTDVPADLRAALTLAYRHR